MSSAPRLTALLLAGQRDGRLDPLAEAAGVAFKAFAPVAGRPMMLHVLDTLAGSERVGDIVISINAGSGVERMPEVAALIAAGRLRVVEAHGNLVDSVLAALDAARFPALITTADNVLLSAAAVAQIDGEARRGGADVAVAMARRGDVLAAHPEGQRKFYRCSDDSYSNCNSYWIGHRGALGPAELFRSGGQFVKYPLRVVGALGFRGVFELVRFRLGYGTLEGAFGRLSRRFGLTMRPVVLTDGAVAIDVDNERSLKVAEEVLAGRAAASLVAAQ